MILGFGQGIAQYYRFSALELAEKKLKSQAMTLVLSGGVFAAVLGPLAASLSAEIYGNCYFGSFIIMAIIGALNFCAIFYVKFPQENQIEKLLDESTKSSSQAVQARTLFEIVSQPKFIVACAVSTLAHSTMTMVMSNCAVEMMGAGFTLSSCSFVMSAHFIAMFAPGFFAGQFIGLYGPMAVATAGILLFLASGISFILGVTFLNFCCGMVLLGIAWNFCFSSGTIMLTDCYKPTEATYVQSVNDFILFFCAALSSILGGLIYNMYCWVTLMYSMFGIILLAILFLIFQVNTEHNMESPQFLLSALVDKQFLPQAKDELVALSDYSKNSIPNSYYDDTEAIRTDV